MDDSRISRSSLERMSSLELSRLADRYGIDIPPELERMFIIEELLDLTRDDDEEGGGEEEPPLREAGFLEPVPLPKQYNITYIEVMIRDPLWAFAFWEVKGADREFYEKSPDFLGYCLRVSPVDSPAGGKNSFTVSVGPEDGGWYLCFPPAEGRYTVALCAEREGEETVLALSQPFRLPGLFDGARAAQSPLGRLSGAEDFPVLRQVDRFSRPLGRPSFGTDGNG